MCRKYLISMGSKFANTWMGKLFAGTNRGRTMIILGRRIGIFQTSLMTLLSTNYFNFRLPISSYNLNELEKIINAQLEILGEDFSDPIGDARVEVGDEEQEFDHIVEHVRDDPGLEFLNRKDIRAFITRELQKECAFSYRDLR
jgi:hypothetical protein